MTHPADAASSTPGATAPRFSPGAKLAGRFAVAEFLGHDFFGEVYRATDASDGKGVVIKLLRPDLVAAPGALARLQQDVAVAVQLDHKNICQTYGLFQEQGAPFVASELVEGGTLQEMIEKRRAAGKGFSAKAAYNLIAHACNALAYAHGALTHGALTPASVLVNASGRVKIADFGLGRTLVASPATRAQAGLGAFATFAPELGPSGKPFEQVDRRSDIYAVAAILYEALTGRPAVQPIESLSKLVPDLPAALDAIVETCLAVDPDERFHEAQELRNALHGALESVVGAPTTAPPSPAPPPPAPTLAPPSAAVRPAPPVAPAAAPLKPAAAVAKPPGPGAAKPAAKVAPGFNLDTALSGVDETQERWLIQKDKLDFGPFRLAEVKTQIEKGQIKGDHTIIDMENGERRRVKDHPLLRDLVLQIEGHFEETARAEAEAAEARAHKRRLTMIVGFGVVVVAGAGATMAYFASREPKERERIIYREREGDLKVEFAMKVEPPPPKRPKRPKSAKPGGSGELSDVTNLGDVADEGGDETLAADVVQKVMTSNYKVLTGCIMEERRRNPGLKNIEMEFAIKGSGQVSGVKVNGANNTPFSTCMYGKMQSVSFPKFNGAQTRATFTLALK